MLFSSIPFLYYFLPILLLIYFIIPNQFKNMVLLLFSLFFYFYGEPIHICILIGSCLINYITGILIAKYAQTKKSFYILIGAIFINIFFLFYFKYIDFMIQNWNALVNGSIPLRHIAMPLGISFVIFNHTDLYSLGKTLQNLFGFEAISLMNAETLYYRQSYFFFLMIAFISTTPIVKMIYVKIREKFRFCELFEPFIWMALLIICTSYLVDVSFNPFLYFRF